MKGTKIFAGMVLAGGVWLVGGCGCAGAAGLSDAEAQRIGQRVWQNECGGTVDGLTSWNKGEQFASMGIGHFLWYPKGANGPFEEKFPALVAFLGRRGVALPRSLAGAPDIDCPWPDRESFLRDFRSARMQEIRALLAATVAEQAHFLVLRLEEALPKMTEAVESEKRGAIRARFQRVLSAEGGAYALVDYVNFKGEGTKESERYKGEGWGLLQVLEKMRDSGDPAREFGKSAAAVLRRRVENSPPERKESRWLQGWLNRVAGYGS